MNKKILFLLLSLFLIVLSINVFGADVFNFTNPNQYYIIINASSFNSTAYQSGLTTGVDGIYNIPSTNMWVIYSLNSNYEVAKAIVLKSLYWDGRANNSNTSPYMRNVSFVYTSLAKDNSSRGILAYNTGGTFFGTNSETETSTFDSNNNSQVDIYPYISGGASPNCASGNIALNGVSTVSASCGQTIDNSTSNTSVWTQSTPSNFQFNYGGNSGTGSGGWIFKTFLVSRSANTSSFVRTGGGTYMSGLNIVDYTKQASFPLLQYNNNFTIYAFNKWNGSQIISYSAIINGVQYNTSNGMLITPFQKNGNLLNVTVIDNEGLFFNNSLVNYNISNDLQTDMFQSVINFSCFEKITGNQLSCVNQTIFPNVGLYNFSINVSGYYTQITNNSNISALNNKTINVTGFYSSNLSLTSTPKVAGQILTNCTYTLQGITYPSYTETIIGTPNTTIGLINGTYSITDNCLGSALAYLNVTIYSSVQSLNFSVYTLNSINLTFRDALTQNIINSNLTIQFIGGSSQTNTTSTGNLYVDLLSPSDYTILTSGSGYIQNSYLLTLINQTYNPITIYLQPSSNTTYYVLFTVIDKLSRQPLQGATVTIQRWINNAWVTEQIYTTDFNGRGQGYFLLNTQYYNFVITYNGITYSGQLNSDANKKIIYYQDYLDGLGIEISLAQTNYINTIQNINSVTTSLKYVNQTNSSGYFVYNWLDSTGNSRNATLNVYQNNILNCTSSASSSSGSINCFVDANDSELFFVATTFIDGIPDKGMTQKVGVSPEWNFDWGIGGWIFTIFVVIIAFTAFAQVPALSIMLGSIFFALALFFNILFTQNLNVSQLGIVIVFIAFLIAKIPSNSGVNG